MDKVEGMEELMGGYGEDLVILARAILDAGWTVNQNGQAQAKQSA